jgi:AraC-like DNA-binding protein
MNPERLNIPEGRDGRLWLDEGSFPMPRPHLHREVELNLVLAGRARYLLPRGRYDLSPRCLVWLFPEQQHLLIDQSPDFKAWIVIFRPGLVARASRGPYAPLGRGDPGLDWLRRLEPASAAALAQLLADLDRSASVSAPTFNAGMHYLLLGAYDRFLRATTLEAIADIHPAVSKATGLLQHGAADCSEEALAAQAGISRSHLSRLFRQQTGVSLVEFRNRLRVERFMQRYGGGQRVTMLTAALEAGFGSYAQFHRVFKRIAGISPADYRQQKS